MSKQTEVATEITSVSENQELKRNLTKVDLMSIAVGQIIGAGIMAMIGIAIGMTGRSVNIAFIIAAILTLLTSAPQVLVGGTARFKGGQYTQVGAFGGKRLAGVFTMINICTGLGIAIYILSFTEYLISLVPNAPAKLVSIVVLTLLFLLNILGTKQAAILQTVMVVVMAIALGAFVAFGVGKIEPGYFQPPGFMTNGITGLLMASAYLTFAAGGATYVINFSAEAKNPTKDIPFVILVSTIGVSVLYALMATIAAGVLPIEEVANKSLSLVAREIMPYPVFVLFIVGGAMFALLTTLNASIGWITRPVIQACKDGWLPSFFGKISPKFKTPVNALLLFYVIGMIPILFNLDLSTVSNATVILTAIVKVILCFTTLRMPKIMPEIWKKSKFYMKDTLLQIICIIGGIVALFQAGILIFSSSNAQIIGNIVILACAIVYALLRTNKVTMETSYEEG